MTQDLAQLLDRKQPDGSPFFADDEVREVIPLLAAGIARGFPGVTFPEFVVLAVGEVAEKAGVNDKTSPAEMWPAIERYYQEHPSRLASELERLLRSASSSGLDGARALATALGVETSKKPLDSGVRPEGTVPAGPAARFAALDKTKKR